MSIRISRVSLHDVLPQVARAGSLTEQVYRSLRESIADGRLEPGSKITERQLAAALDVSPTPVREALGKLEHEGLVERVGPRRLQIVDHPAETLQGADGGRGDAPRSRGPLRRSQDHA